MNLPNKNTKQHGSLATLIALLEEMQETMEMLASEVPLGNPKRRVFEERLPRIRAAISLIREAQTTNPPSETPKQGNAQ
jgi:hypothetical protein